jgi:hypothetical protein
MTFLTVKGTVSFVSYNHTLTQEELAEEVQKTVSMGRSVLGVYFGEDSTLFAVEVLKRDE